MSVSMAAEKKVALALYDLHEQDRLWILSSLDEDVRERIINQLEQLTALCSSHALNFRELLDDNYRNEKCSLLFKGVNRRDIEHYLERLPDNTVELAAQLFDWPYKNEYLLARRLRIQEHVNHTSVMKPKAIDAFKGCLEKGISIRNV